MDVSRKKLSTTARQTTKLLNRMLTISWLMSTWIAMMLKMTPINPTRSIPIPSNHQINWWCNSHSQSLRFLSSHKLSLLNIADTLVALAIFMLNIADMLVALAIFNWCTGLSVAHWKVSISSYIMDFIYLKCILSRFNEFRKFVYVTIISITLKACHFAY